jgi:heme/copper-type cytochrome/quinol oxidase subunit 2
VAGIRKALERARMCVTNQLAASKKETHMLWTILVIVVIVLAVIGLLAVLRGRA